MDNTLAFFERKLEKIFLACLLDIPKMLHSHRKFCWSEKKRSFLRKKDLRIHDELVKKKKTNEEMSVGPEIRLFVFFQFLF